MSGELQSGELQVVYADMLAASATFKQQSQVFKRVTEYGEFAFQGACDPTLYAALQTFFQVLDTGQQAIADAMYGHGVKLKLAHDNYDNSEQSTKASIEGIYQALRSPDEIE